MPRIARASAVAVAALLACASPAAAAQVIADHLTRQTGDPHVLFDDTSTSPANDWRLGTIQSGVGNRFVLDDVTGARTPFQVLAGAPTDSFFLSSSGNLGLGTSNPGLDLQTTSANTPAIRLEQTDAGGFRAQPWDIGANESNFFVRDLTSGSRLSLRIRPGAPTSSIDVRGREGEAGFGGVRAPAGHPATSASARAPRRRRCTSCGRTAPRDYWSRRRAPPGTAASSPTSSTTAPRSRASRTPRRTARTGRRGTGTRRLRDQAVRRFRRVHAVAVGRRHGGRRAPADVDPAATESREPVDGDQVLERIAELPVESFEYADDASDARHVGPSGADFRAAFGLGASDAAVAPGDLGGVSLAATQALARNAAAADARVDGVAGRLAVVEGVIGALGGDVGALKPIGTQLGDLGTKMTGMEAADTTAARKIKALRAKARKQNKRLKRLERKLRALTRRR